MVELDRRFRRDIEGLRAVAVILVLFFHAEVPGFAGGYVGVDVFFVLSGYLITRLLLRERRATGTIRLLDFYGRRLRRLLPAAGLVIVTTMVAARFILPPLLVSETAIDGAWAAAWLANLRFIRVGLDYLAGSGAESPLLHYWSLAVEEQFYLLWPALILLVARSARSRIGRRIAGLILVVSIGSFATSVLLTRSNPVVAYYGLHTRAWEFALGAALSLAMARTVQLGVATRTVLGWGGLAAIVAAGVTYTLGTPFPGWTALVPVLGTVAVIAAGDGGDSGGVGRLLALRPLQLIGRSSYALYLWHWPVLVLGEHALGGATTGTERTALLLLSAGLAWATFHLLEDPVRRARVLRPPTRSIAFGGALVAGTLACALLVTVTAPTLTGRGTGEVAGGPATDEQQLARLIDAALRTDLLPATLEPPLAAVDDARSEIYEDGCFAGWTDEASDGCTYGDPEAERSIVLFGDSHAAHWFPALDRLAERIGVRLVVLAKASCPSIDVVVSRAEDAYPTCATWREASLERIERERPELVVFSNARAYLALDAARSPLDVDRRQHLVAGQSRTIDAVRARIPQAGLALIGTTARPGFDVPTCLSENLDDIEPCHAEPTQAVDVTSLEAQAAMAKTQGVTFVDPTPWLCNDEGCPAVIGDQLVYSDSGHLAVPFNRSLAPLLGEALYPR